MEWLRRETAQRSCATPANNSIFYISHMKIADYLQKIADTLEHASREAKGAKIKTRVSELKESETRKALAEVVLALFERWELHELNQATLLGLVDVKSLKQGEPLPEDSAVLERVGHLMAIDRALMKRYPYQPKKRDRWISQPEPRLGDKTPLNFMLAGGIPAIREVRAVVESGITTRQPG